REQRQPQRPRDRRYHRRVEPDLRPWAVIALQRAFRDVSLPRRREARIADRDIRNDQEAPGPQNPRGLGEKSTARGEMKNRFNAQHAMETGAGEWQLARVGLDEVEIVAGTCRDLAADAQLARIDVHTGQRHAAQARIDGIERATKPATDVENRLTRRKPGQ